MIAGRGTTPIRHRTSSQSSTSSPRYIDGTQDTADLLAQKLVSHNPQESVPLLNYRKAIVVLTSQTLCVTL